MLREIFVLHLVRFQLYNYVYTTCTGFPILKHAHEQYTISLQMSTPDFDDLRYILVDNVVQ